MILEEQLAYDDLKKSTLETLTFNPEMPNSGETIEQTFKNQITQLEGLAKKLKCMDDFSKYRKMAEAQFVEYGKKYASHTGRFEDKDILM